MGTRGWWLALLLGCGDPELASEPDAQPSSPNCPFVYREGHGDLFVDYQTNGGLSLALRSELEPGAGELLYDPTLVCIVVPASTHEQTVGFGGRPGGAAWDALGVGAGAPFWFLPQVAIAGVPWFGIAPEGVSAALFDPDVLTLELREAKAPPGGEFSAWSSNTFGQPTFAFSTAAAVSASPRIAGSHDHLSWGFTAAGEYELTFVATAHLAATGERLESPPVTFRFLVEPTP
jgi:surface-anchored protein